MHSIDNSTTPIHPMTAAINEIRTIFAEMDFTVAEGPELEEVKYNFDMLNFPPEHPARDMQDTFFVDAAKTHVLRTHTSNMQVRYIEEMTEAGKNPPYRLIVPGKVYRNEATDMTHEACFYQVEGLVVDTDTSLAHLKGTLAFFFERFFGGSVEVRLRPSFFPFTEPSVEVDMRLTGDTAPAKLKDKWIEIMGAGMVHPNVLRASGIDPDIYRGFAFGGGIERICMLKWGVDDVRYFHNGDMRLVSQFIPAATNI
jgi:phenylalanyl-tRNA synthetase alpha chain